MRKASLKSRKWIFLLLEPSLIQKKVLERLQSVGGALNESYITQKCKKKKKENKKPELVTRKLYIR